MQPDRVVSMADFDERLDEGLQTMALVLDAHARKRLLDYQTLIQKWNRVYNLTAIRDPQQMLIQHLLDSLSIVPPLRERLASVPSPMAIDVGSGAGLPGIPMAIAWPSINVTMVEPVGKKSAFIQHAIGALGLNNAASVQCRIEQLRQSPAMRAAPGHPTPALAERPPDLIMSRAFASLADFATGVESVAGPKTLMAAMKGLLPDAEINDLPPGWQVLESLPLKVPGLQAQRHLILFSRSA